MAASARPIPMKAKFFFLICFLSMFFACKETCPVEKDCLEKTLQELGMVSYQGQELGCNLHLALYRLYGEQYFMLRNHCADMVAYPFDCDGNKLCETGETPNCTQFYESAQYVGIVGIKEP